MALKDIWTNKTDGVDDILADDINAIAHEVINNTENKADKATVYNKSETDTIFSTKADKEVWEKVVDIEITEPISTSFRQEFGKQFKKIRFKIEVKGTGTATIRFKRDINDGGTTNIGVWNFLKIASVNLSTMRYIVGTAYFDLDNFICIKDGVYGTQTSTLSTGSATAKSDTIFAEEMQFFDEIFFHFGADCTVSSGKIEVWGCEV